MLEIQTSRLKFIFLCVSGTGRRTGLRRGRRMEGRLSRTDRRGGVAPGRTAGVLRN